MTTITEDPLLGLVQNRHPIITNNTIDGTSNSLFDGKMLWNEDRALTYIINSNYTIKCVSSSALDGVGNIGAKKLRITGLLYFNDPIEGHTYKHKQIDVDLNGTTEVEPLDPLFWRVISVECLNHGSSLMNQGDIKIYVSGLPNNILNCVKAHDNISNSLIASPPTGHLIVLEKIHINSYFHTASEVRLNIINEFGIKKTFQKFFVNSNSTYVSFPIRKQLIAGETFYISLHNLEPIIGTNNITALLESTYTEHNTPYKTFYREGDNDPQDDAV